MQAAENTDYKSLYEASQLRIVTLEQQLSQLQKMIFGSKHERFVPTEVNPSQLSLDIEAESAAVCSIVDAKKITYTRTNESVEQKPMAHPGRMQLPQH